MARKSELAAYLVGKRETLAGIQKEFQKYPEIYKMFRKRNWFPKVESQIALWEQNLKGSLKERKISVPEYKLFRYLEDDSFLQRFIESFVAIERKTQADRTKYQQWKGSKNQLFSAQASQIYSTIFEMLMLGRLISSPYDIEPYYNDIDGRIKVTDRYIYFEIKSLQMSRFDLKGIGVGGTQHDERQIYDALGEKAAQLGPYQNKPTLVFLSLYRLADPTTANWYIPDFFETDLGRGISGVAIFGWFTAEGTKRVLFNPQATIPFSTDEKTIIEQRL